MIGANRIREIARLSGMRPWQQEKHYLQSLILTIISDYPLVFKGGTYLWLFHGLNRFSEDLDFTAKGPLERNFTKLVSRSLNLYGYENEIKILKDDKLGLSVRFLINGPLHSSDKDRCVIYVEVSGREKIVLPSLSLKIDFPQYDIPVKNLSGMNLDEVGGEKVRAILTREKGRDIFDLYYLIRRKNIKFNIELVNRKLAYYNLNFDSSQFMQKLESRNEIYSKELKPVILGDLPDFNEVRSYIGKWIASGYYFC